MKKDAHGRRLTLKQPFMRIQNLIMTIAFGLLFSSSMNGQLSREIHEDKNGYFTIYPPFNWDKAVPVNTGTTRIYFEKGEEMCLYVDICIVDFDMDSLYSLYAALDPKKNPASMKREEFRKYDAIFRTIKYDDRCFYTLEFLIEKTYHKLTFYASAAQFDRFLPVVMKSMNTYRPQPPDAKRDWAYAQLWNVPAAYKKFLLQHPDSKFTEEANTRWQQAQHDHDWRMAKDSCSIEAYRNFLKKYPNSGFWEQIQTVLAQMEADHQDWQQTLALDTLNGYLGFVERRPQSPFAEKAQKIILDMKAYQSAVEKDWHDDYKKYLLDFPVGKYHAQASKRYAWLTSHHANPVADYPSSVEYTKSPYSNVSGPFFQWKVTFSETGGASGYKVKGSGWYYDNAGVPYGEVKGSGWYYNNAGVPYETEGKIMSTREILIRPGGNEVYDTWFSGARFIGGYILYDFKGEDAGGHPVDIQVRIDCK